MRITNNIIRKTNGTTNCNCLNSINKLNEKAVVNTSGITRKTLLNNLFQIES